LAAGWKGIHKASAVLRAVRTLAPNNHFLGEGADMGYSDFVTPKLVLHTVFGEVAEFVHL
jgi:hypothetical protein